MGQTRMNAVFKVCVHHGYTQWNPDSFAQACWLVPTEGLCLKMVAVVVKMPYWVCSKEMPLFTMLNRDLKCSRGWHSWVHLLSRSVGVHIHICCHPCVPCCQTRLGEAVQALPIWSFSRFTKSGRVRAMGFCSLRVWDLRLEWTLVPFPRAVLLW